MLDLMSAPPAASFLMLNISIGMVPEYSTVHTEPEQSIGPQLLWQFR